MDSTLNLADPSVLVNGAGRRIRIVAVKGDLVDHDRIGASQPNRADRPCPIPHYAPAPAGYSSASSHA
jgi:hypothetical protein